MPGTQHFNLIWENCGPHRGTTNQHEKILKAFFTNQIKTY